MRYIPRIPKGNVGGEIWWHDSHNRSGDLLEWYETDEVFGFIRNDERFANILSELKVYAK